MPAIRTALLSVSDKTGLVEFAAALHALGVKLLSTGGTAKALRDAGLPVTLVEDFTGFPEMLGGRLKTLHPKVHGGLLALRDDPEHAAAAARHALEPIDLLCVNLYPFEATVVRPHAAHADAIENIDIGGPAMIRSAAKNHAFVTVVIEPGQYPAVLADLHQHQGDTTPALRARLAAEAFARTAAYDAAIARYLVGHAPAAQGGPRPFPARLALAYVKDREARYGENPHQRAAVYRDDADPARSVLRARQLHGKELSYNNVLDASAALALATDLSRVASAPAACVIKHANPCGAAVGASPQAAVRLALAGDPLAAFGGILCLAGVCDESAAALLTTKDTFLEVIIADEFTDGALTALRARSASVRLLAAGHPPATVGNAAPWSLRSIPGGLLVQEPDTLPPRPADWRHAAGPAPSALDVRAAAALEVIVRAMSSNAVAIGAPVEPSGVALVGAGLGQVDRLTACRVAVEKAGPRASGAIAASDAFFPFPDGPSALIDAGVRLILQPGGSKRDQETLDLCAARAVTCLLTGVRRFRH